MHRGTLGGLGNGLRVGGIILLTFDEGPHVGRRNVCFIMLEDETGTANLVVWPKAMEAFRKTVMQARLLVVEGRVQREVEIVHAVAEWLIDRINALLRPAPEGLAPALSHADEMVRPIQGSARSPRPGHPRDARVIPGSRDFR